MCLREFVCGVPFFRCAECDYDTCLVMIRLGRKSGASGSDGESLWYH